MTKTITPDEMIEFLDDKIETCSEIEKQSCDFEGMEYEDTDNIKAWKAIRDFIRAHSRDISFTESVHEQLKEDAGYWHSCSGCHETIDGYETGAYPYSETFKCHVGSGCRECGGLGVIWDNTDYSKMIESVPEQECA